MRERVRVAIIGGGIGGLSTLYHLAEAGWRDLVLLERDELTSGTTWHSAAQVTHFGTNQVMIGLKAHSIALYRELAADPPYPVGYHYGDGGIRLATTEAQMEGYRHFASLARAMGVTFEVIDAAECGRRHQLIRTDGLLGGLWDPHDGDIDPAQLCGALAARARAMGAQILRRCPVTGLAQNDDDSWTLRTPEGEIRAEIIVNAGGYRCNEIGAMMAVVHPVISMEHQYLVTEDIPEIAALGRRVPLLRCPTDDFYSRQERQGLLVGFYEQDCRPWGLGGIDPDFSMALCPDDLERISPVFERALARLPVLESAGIKRVVNGPITYSADGLPLVGPVPGRRKAFCIIGLRAGLGEGGGHGWLLSQIITRGEAEWDTWPLDPRRFGPHANLAYTTAKAVEDYRNEFRFHFPNEHRPAGRPAFASPLAARLEARGARLAPVAGWERHDVFAPAGFRETLTFRFSEAEPLVAAEVRRVASEAAVMDLSGFTRLRLSGPDADRLLERVLCGPVPRRAGRVGLGYLLNEAGCLKTEATIARLPAGEGGEAGEIWYGAAAAARVHDRDWVEAHARGLDVAIDDLTESWTALVLAGPKARAVMSRAARGDWSAEAFPWLSVRRTFVGVAPAVVMAVSYSGESALELHVPTASALAAFDALAAAFAALRAEEDREEEAGERPGLFGLRATESMRIEKGFVHFKREIITEIDPFEAGLDRFVRLERAGFVGREALERRAERGAARRLVMLAVEDAEAPAHAGAAVLDEAGRAVVGAITSGAFGHRTGLNLAFALCAPEVARIGSVLRVDSLGRAVPARVVPRVSYDPDGRRMRQ